MQLPPALANDRGEERRIGVEIEFHGLDSATAAALVCRLFGGRVQKRDPNHFVVEGTRFGNFEIELDSRYAHVDEEPAARREDTDWADLATDMKRGLASAFAEVAGLWLPTEIVSPPVPLTRLPELDRLIPALREAGALGTDQGLLYAFGTQLNPEVPSLQADSLLRHLQAYVLLADRLRAAVDVDALRSMLPFADPFPPAYARRIVAADYRPGLEQLIDDYLDANPTRNRELDMLPLFAHLQRERVSRRLPDVKIKARPTFHYRLPDTRLSNPQWSVVTEWNRWAEVERLAADADALGRHGAAFLAAGASS